MTGCGADAMRSRIKICGLSRSCDIDYVNEAMPDYIGFVFAESPRQVNVGQAGALKEKLNPEICAVGVFVNERAEVIAGLAEQGIIRMVQLHGQEDEAYISQLRRRLDGLSVGIIKAFSVKSAKDVKRACQSSADYILLDHGRGGTGQRFDWRLTEAADRPFFLAGGLCPDNIEAACRTGAFALDVSSGAETDGRKDREKIKLLMKAVSQASL